MTERIARDQAARILAGAVTAFTEGVKEKMAAMHAAGPRYALSANGQPAGYLYCDCGRAYLTFKGSSKMASLVRAATGSRKLDYSSGTGWRVWSAYGGGFHVSFEPNDVIPGWHGQEMDAYEAGVEKVKAYLTELGYGEGLGVYTWVD